MMNQEVRQIMTTNPTVAAPNQKMNIITAIMKAENLQELPVVSENGKLLGLINSQALHAAYKSRNDLEHISAREVMDQRVLKIAPKDKVGTAAELFADKRFKLLPVVNLRNELKGIITAFNLVKVAFNAEYRSPILYDEAFN